MKNEKETESYKIKKYYLFYFYSEIFLFFVHFKGENQFIRDNWLRSHFLKANIRYVM